MRLLLPCLLLATLDWLHLTTTPSTDSATIDSGMIRGIDVSHHQGSIDWSAVRAGGIGFAYIKASEGATHRDASFAANWSGAGEAGLERGAYHFFTFCRDADEQADNFLGALPQDATDLPPAIDVELGGNCDRRPPAEEVCASLRRFLRRVEGTLGRGAILYVTDESLSLYGDCLPDRPLWFRSLSGGVPVDPIAVWQFDEQVTIRGIEGLIDLDVVESREALTGLRSEKGRRTWGADTDTSFLIARALDRALRPKGRERVGDVPAVCTDARIAIDLADVSCRWFGSAHTPASYSCTLESTQVRGDAAIDLVAALDIAGAQGESASSTRFLHAGGIYCEMRRLASGGGASPCAWDGWCWLDVADKDGDHGTRRLPRRTHE